MSDLEAAIETGTVDEKSTSEGQLDISDPAADVGENTSDKGDGEDQKCPQSKGDETMDEDYARDYEPREEESPEITSVSGNFQENDNDNPPFGNNNIPFSQYKEEETVDDDDDARDYEQGEEKSPEITSVSGNFQENDNDYQPFGNNNIPFSQSKEEETADDDDDDARGYEQGEEESPEITSVSGNFQENDNDYQPFGNNNIPFSQYKEEETVDDDDYARDYEQREEESTEITSVSGNFQESNNDYQPFGNNNIPFSQSKKEETADDDDYARDYEQGEEESPEITSVSCNFQENDNAYQPFGNNNIPFYQSKEEETVDDDDYARDYEQGEDESPEMTSVSGNFQENDKDYQPFGNNNIPFSQYKEEETADDDDYARDYEQGEEVSPEITSVSGNFKENDNDNQPFGNNNIPFSQSKDEETVDDDDYARDYEQGEEESPEITSVSGNFQENDNDYQPFGNNNIPFSQSKEEETVDDDDDARGYEPREEESPEITSVSGNFQESNNDYQPFGCPFSLFNGEETMGEDYARDYEQREEGSPEITTVSGSFQENHSDYQPFGNNNIPFSQSKEEETMDQDYARGYEPREEESPEITSVSGNIQENHNDYQPFGYNNIPEVPCNSIDIGQSVHACRLEASVSEQNQLRTKTTFAFEDQFQEQALILFEDDQSSITVACEEQEVPVDNQSVTISEGDSQADSLSDMKPVASSEYEGICKQSKYASEAKPDIGMSLNGKDYVIIKIEKRDRRSPQECLNGTLQDAAKTENCHFNSPVESLNCDESLNETKSNISSETCLSNDTTSLVESTSKTTDTAAGISGPGEQHIIQTGNTVVGIRLAEHDTTNDDPSVGTSEDHEKTDKESKDYENCSDDLECYDEKEGKTESEINTKLMDEKRSTLSWIFILKVSCLLILFPLCLGKEFIVQQLYPKPIKDNDIIWTKTNFGMSYLGDICVCTVGFQGPTFVPPDEEPPDLQHPDLPSPNLRASRNESQGNAGISQDNSTRRLAENDVRNSTEIAIPALDEPLMCYLNDANFSIIAGDYNNDSDDYTSVRDNHLDITIRPERNHSAVPLPSLMNASHAEPTFDFTDQQKYSPHVPFTGTSSQVANVWFPQGETLYRRTLIVLDGDGSTVTQRRNTNSDAEISEERDRLGTEDFEIHPSYLFDLTQFDQLHGYIPPGMSDRFARARTFVLDPWPHSHTIPQQMADAGLFYTGIRDVTRCFYCGNCIDHWKPGDDPLTEHRNLYPDCNFVITASTEVFDKFHLLYGNSDELQPRGERDRSMHGGFESLPSGSDEMFGPLSRLESSGVPKKLYSRNMSSQTMRAAGPHNEGERADVQQQRRRAPQDRTVLNRRFQPTFHDTTTERSCVHQRQPSDLYAESPTRNCVCPSMQRINRTGEMFRPLNRLVSSAVTTMSNQTMGAVSLYNERQRADAQQLRRRAPPDRIARNRTEPSIQPSLQATTERSCVQQCQPCTPHAESLPRNFAQPPIQRVRPIERIVRPQLNDIESTLDSPVGILLLYEGYPRTAVAQAVRQAMRDDAELSIEVLVVLLAAIGARRRRHRRTKRY